MTTETLIILLTFVLSWIYYFMPSPFVARRVGARALVGPRDNIKPADSVMEQRALRATANFKETLPWAIGLLILVQVTGDANATTALGGWLYLISRIIYIPAYLLGTSYLRSIVWTVSIIGLIMIAAQLL